MDKAIQNVSRKELGSLVDKLFTSAKKLKPSVKPTPNKLNFKEMFEKAKKGHSAEEIVGPLPKSDPLGILPGEERYDDQISITSDFNYPAGLLQIVGGDKDLVRSFNEMDAELASFDSDIKNQIDEKLLKGLQFKGEAPEVDWDHLNRIAPSFIRPQVQQIRKSYESINEIPDNYEQLLLSYETEYEELLEKIEADDKLLDERIEFFDQELERTKDFYEKLPTLTIHEFCEMEPELYEMALDELDRKVNTVGWDPVIEPTPKQVENEEHLKRVLGLRSLPELP